MKWFAKAPSNIALIKYMGKSQQNTNTPTNTSISYTLNNLLSFVEIEISKNLKQDIWQPMSKEGCQNISLSLAAKTRFLKHFALIKNEYNIEENFIVRSCNNFPHATGMASSASSFAALTKCAIKAMCEISNIPRPSTTEMAKISKLGSGSSCRSFFSPWAIWKQDKISDIELPYTDLIHQTLIVSTLPKKISSSDAHLMVKTSPLFNQRISTIEDKANNLILQMQKKNWLKIYQIVKEEFLNMHLLFETSKKPFSFMTDSSKKIIDDIEYLWNSNKDGPLITMDAGPNVHLLYRQDQIDLSKKIYKNFSKMYEIL